MTGYESVLRPSVRYEFAFLLNFIVKVIKYFLERSLAKKRETYNKYVEKRHARIARATFIDSVDKLADDKLRKETAAKTATKGLTSLRSKS